MLSAQVTCIFLYKILELCLFIPPWIKCNNILKTISGLVGWMFSLIYQCLTTLSSHLFALLPWPPANLLNVEKETYEKSLIRFSTLSSISYLLYLYRAVDKKRFLSFYYLGNHLFFPENGKFVSEKSSRWHGKAIFTDFSTMDPYLVMMP